MVSAIPVGMRAHPGAPVEVGLLDAGTWVADVKYCPLETQLLAEAKAKGCRTLEESGMAVNQAIDVFELFSGSTADPERTRERRSCPSGPEHSRPVRGCRRPSHSSVFSAGFCFLYSLAKLMTTMPAMMAKVSHSAYLSMTLRMSTAAAPSW